MMKTMKKIVGRLGKGLILFLLALTFSAGGVEASTIWVAQDIGGGPIQQWSDTGVFLGTFGDPFSNSVALDHMGSVYVGYGGSKTTVVQYDADENPISSFVYDAWIEDMTWGGDNTLWVGLNTGEVQHITTSGTLLSSFNPGHGFFPGVTTDGSYLYLTDGLNGPGAIETWTFDGTMLSSVSTGFNQNLGIGYDASDGTFWVGYYEIVRHFDSSGNFLGSISGGLGAWHDGIDVGEIGTVPDASIMFLLGSSLMGLAVFSRKSKKS